MSALGAEISRYLDDVRFTPKSGHSSVQLQCPLRAKSGLTQCSNWDRYSITSSASAKKFTGSSMPVAFAVLRLMTSL